MDKRDRSNDASWNAKAELLVQYKQLRKQYELLEAKTLKELIALSNDDVAYGNGFFLTYDLRKGNVDYSSIPELQNIDLDKYRKPSYKAWTLNSAIDHEIKKYGN